MTPSSANSDPDQPRLGREGEQLEPLVVIEPVAAKLLSVCPRTMYNLRKQGLPFVKLTAGIHYKMADLKALIEQRTQTLKASA